MYQVKVFSNYEDGGLMEMDINQFLSENNIRIVDIKYQNWNDNHPEMVPGNEIFSVMITYRTEE